MTGLGVAAMLGILGVLVAVFMAVAPASECAEVVRIMRTGKVKLLLFASVLFGAATVLASVFIFVLSP